MLEVFFDNEKIFSVLNRILHTDNAEDINIARICYDLKLSPEAANNIITKLEFLGFIRNNDSSLKSVESFSLNTDSDLLYELCLFDDLVGNFVKNKLMSENKDNKENGNFQDMLKRVNIDEISVRDFIDMINKN